MTTQISGKYSVEDDEIFKLKNKFESIGITVKFPENDYFVAEHNGIPVTFIPEVTKTLYEVELEFFESLKTSDFHLVNNKFKLIDGYLGESASLEIAYSILHNIPLVFTNDLFKFSEKAPTYIQLLILSKRPKFFFVPVHSASIEELKQFLKQLPNKVNYKVHFKDELLIIDCIRSLILSYK